MDGCDDISTYSPSNPDDELRINVFYFIEILHHVMGILYFEFSVICIQNYNLVVLTCI